MFTKDISLEDCVLDLIDNSVDGFVNSRNLRLSRIASAIWEKNGAKKPSTTLPQISVSISEAAFEIEDNCGGIDLDAAVKISVPLLTRKERLHLDTAMPCRKNWRPKVFEMKPEDIATYREIHPYFPAYIEGLL